MSQLRLITYNIAHGRGLSPYQGLTSNVRVRYNLLRIARLLRTLQADIVALQEIDFDSHWNGRIDMLEFLREKMRFPHACQGVNNIRAGKKPLRYGNAFLSRQPLCAWGNHPFGSARLGEKGFLYAQVDFGDRLLPLINLHLDFRSKNRRLAQLGQVTEFVKSLGARENGKALLAPLVCGDFNVGQRPGSDAVRELLRFLAERDGYELYPQGKGSKTFPSFFPTRALDFVFVPKTVQVARCEVLPVHFSDHRPVLIDLKS